MSKKHLIFGLVGSIAMAACGPTDIDYKYIDDVYYINNSSHVITVRSFEYDGKFLSEVVIHEQDTIYRRDDFQCGGHPETMSFYSFSDSVEIVYGNSRADRFTFSDSLNKANVLWLFNYEEEQIAKRHNKYTFRFTDEMYDNAKYIIAEE